MPGEPPTTTWTATPPPGVVRLALRKNLAPPLAVLAIIAPALAVFAALAALASALSARGALRSPAAQLAFGLLVMGAFIGTMLASHARSARSTHGALELAPGEVTLFRGERAVRAPLVALTVQPLMHRYQGRSASFDYPSVALTFPDERGVVIGVMAPGVVWAGVEPCEDAPRYLVAHDEWLRLVDHLGLRGSLRAP